MDDFPLDITDLPEINVDKGYVLFEQGSFGITAFVLKSGIVSVAIGDRHLCDLSEPGTIVGEISCLLESVHTAKVKAETQCTMYLINDFEVFCKNPKNSYTIMKLLAQRLANMNEDFLGIKGDMRKLEKKEGKISSLMARMDRFLAKGDGTSVS